MNTIKATLLFTLAIATATVTAMALASGTASARSFGGSFGHGPVASTVSAHRIFGTGPLKCYVCGSGFTITHGGNPPVYHPPHPGHGGWHNYGHGYDRPLAYAGGYAGDECVGEYKVRLERIGFGYRRVIRKVCELPVMDPQP
jgi:hypothetical protein